MDDELKEALIKLVDSQVEANTQMIKFLSECRPLIDESLKGLEPIEPTKEKFKEGENYIAAVDLNSGSPKNKGADKKKE